MTDPVPRLRQICLLARDLEWTSRVLSTAFDAPVVFRDSRMAAAGSLRRWPDGRSVDQFAERVKWLLTEVQRVAHRLLAA